MSNQAFTAIKPLLVPYAKHFTVSEDTADRYVLNEDFQYSRTMFGYLHTSRGGARLIFYPLNVFPELHAGLPRSLASKVKSKYVLAFKTVTAAERKALAKLFAAGWRAIEDKRSVIGPDRGYYRKIDLATTTKVVTELVDSSLLRLAKSHLEIRLAGITRLPRVLAGKETKPGVLKLKTITPAELEALRALVTKHPALRASVHNG